MLSSSIDWFSSWRSSQALLEDFRHLRLTPSWKIQSDRRKHLSNSHTSLKLRQQPLSITPKASRWKNQRKTTSANFLTNYPTFRLAIYQSSLSFPFLLPIIPCFITPWMGCYSIAKLPPALSSPVPIYTPGWREALWDWVKCLAKYMYTKHRNYKSTISPQLRLLG